jgi:hypothetical protein
MAAPQAEESFPTVPVAALTALGALYIGIFWWRNDSFLDSDEAVVGLMARHILHRGEWPVFYWGQEYLGAVEAYLAAGLFAIFGSSVRVLKLVPVLFTVFTAPIAAQLAHMAVGRRGALFAAFVFATPPVAFTIWSIKTRGGFTEPAEMGFFLLWMALRLVSATSERRRWGWALGMGLTLGLGLWWSYFVVPYALVALSALFFFPSSRGWRTWALGLGGTFLGALPALWRNAFTTHWATIIHALHPDPSQARAGQPDHAVPAQAWVHLRQIELPAMLGFHDARVTPFAWEGAEALAAFLLCALALFGAGIAVARSVRGGVTLARVAAGGGLAGGVLMVGLYVFSRFGFEPEPRYVLAVWMSVGWCYALAAWQFSQWKSWAGFAVCMAIALHQAYWTFGVERPIQIVQWNPNAPATTSYAALAEQLKAQGTTHINADYWTSERITFESNEEIIAADPHQDRNQDALQIVRGDPASCWLSTPGSQADQMVRRRGWRRQEFTPNETPGLVGSQVLACP